MLALIPLIPLFPLAGFLFAGLAGTRVSKRAVGLVACGAVLASFVIGLGAVVQLAGMDPGPAGDGRRFETDVATWLPLGSAAPVTFGFQLDPLSAVMLLVVSGVGFLIHLYSTGYMEHEAGFARFFAYLNLFMAMMLTLVLANNFLLMFVGWEGVGLCSYLLIGFYTDRMFDARSGMTCSDAGRKAFLTNRVGDFAFMLGMLFLLERFATLDFSTIMGTIDQHSADWYGAGLLTLVGILLFAGACGKSAQIPLYVWLPDAMAGPTPVSALIHAATMVTAGVYMLARCSALFWHAPAAMGIVAVVGAATAVFAGTMGLVQTDIKKVLAYSTVSQLGYMFLGAGVGAFVGAIFHLMTHAFFKACLFLGSGSVIHAMGGEQDIRRMGGLRKWMPVTALTFTIATVAIAGFPPLAGFFSKDEILLWALASGRGHWALWLAGSIGAAVTAFYMFRLTTLTFAGKFRGTPAQEHHLHESPRSMTVPLIVLAFLAVVGGWIGIPSLLTFGRDINVFHHWLEPVVGYHGAPAPEAGAAFWAPPPTLQLAGTGLHAVTIEEVAPPAQSGAPHTSIPAEAKRHGGHGGSSEGEPRHLPAAAEWGLIALAVAIAAGGMLLARRLYAAGGAGAPERLARAAGPVYVLLARKYWVDELYDFVVLRPFYALCALFHRIDVALVDGTVNGVRHATIFASHLSSAFDRWVVDLGVNAAGWTVRGFSRLVRALQTGQVQQYATAMLFGAVLLLSLWIVIK